MIICIILAILSISYGLFVKAVGSGTLFFCVWILLGFCFLLLAFVLKKGIWKVIPKALRRGILVLFSLGMAAFLVVESFVISGFSQKGEPDLDYIIVLGAQVYESGPSAVLKFRLDRAIEYLNENPDTICIVTGGQGYNEPFPEGEGMRDYLLKSGIEADRILTETESKTTRENVANSMHFLEEGASVGLVTNDFHVFRAVQTAKKAGLTDVCGIAAGSTAVYLPNNMLREFFGEVKSLGTFLWS